MENSDDISDDSVDIMDESKEIPAFSSSTPKDYSSCCQECFDSSECADCIVKQMFRRHSSLRETLFQDSHISGCSRSVFGGKSPPYMSADYN